jgi:hypothetical protein
MWMAGCLIGIYGYAHEVCIYPLLVLLMMLEVTIEDMIFH